VVMSIAALLLNVGIHNENIGVRNRSKPAMNATLLALVMEIPHCWNPDAPMFITPKNMPQYQTVLRAESACTSNS
jgi:hypothetical protein